MNTPRGRAFESRAFLFFFFARNFFLFLSAADRYAGGAV